MLGRNHDYGYPLAILIVGLAWTTRYLLNPVLGTTGTGFSLFFLATILSAWLGGRGPGMVALLLGMTICFWFYVLPSSNNPLTISVQMAIYVFVSGCIVRVVDTMQANERRAKALGDEVRQRNQELERERDRFRVTLASIGDAVVTTGLDSRIAYMNPVAERLSGWTLADAHGEPFSGVVRLVREDDGSEVDLLAATAAPAPQPLEFNYRMVSRDGAQIAVAHSAAPVLAHDGQVSGTVFVFRDATALKNYEATLREADQRKDEFLAVLAHELRNPLAPIQNAVALLGHSSTQMGKQGAWALDVIQRQLRQLVRLVNDLLDIARITRGTLELQRETVELNEIIGQAIEASRHLIDAAGHELRLDLAPGSVRIDADRMRAAQLFSNLINNAAQYTPPGGTIRIASEVRGSEVRISISDTGIGINPQALARIFQMFTRADLQGRHHSGLGVGLGLSKTLVELHGGRIEAHSDGAGRGSLFMITLPVQEHVAPPPEDYADLVEPGSAPRKRVLVVDDNIDAANSLAELLRFSDHIVQVAYDPFVALQMVTQFKPDMLILDIGLPGMDGYELARRVRALNQPQLAQLVALTGWGRREDIEQALQAGFDRHLTKPVMPEQLQAILSGAPQ